MARLALLIDGDNVAASSYPEISAICVQLGRQVIGQVLADYSGNRHGDWLEVARDHGLKPVFQLSGGRGKNSTDIAMTVAAMDILHAGAADVFCIVSSDRDFIPLVQRLRAGKVSVVGVGAAHVDKALVACCDRFHVLAAPEKQVAAPLVPIKLAKMAARSTGPAATKVSADERSFIIDLIDDLCHSSKKPSIQPSALGIALRKANAKLAGRLGGAGFLKRLRENNVVVVHGEGSSRTISARRMA